MLALPDLLTSSMFCAGTDTDQSCTSPGDSGGPAFRRLWRNNAARYELIGVFSGRFRARCARDIGIKISNISTFRSIIGDCGIGHGFYSFVSHEDVLPWIKSNMKQRESTTTRRPSTRRSTTTTTSPTIRAQNISTTATSISRPNSGGEHPESIVKEDLLRILIYIFLQNWTLLSVEGLKAAADKWKFLELIFRVGARGLIVVCHKHVSFLTCQTRGSTTASTSSSMVTSSSVEATRPQITASL